MDETEIIEKIDQFFDKQGLDIQSKYFITKKMNDEYWEDVLGEGEQNEDDPLGDLGEEEPEEPIAEPEEPEEEIAAPTPVRKKKLTVKKPKVIAKIPEKKEETPKEPSEENVAI